MERTVEKSVESNMRLITVEEFDAYAPTLVDTLVSEMEISETQAKEAVEIMRYENPGEGYKFSMKPVEDRFLPKVGDYVTVAYDFTGHGLDISSPKQYKIVKIYNFYKEQADYKAGVSKDPSVNSPLNPYTVILEGLDPDNNEICLLRDTTWFESYSNRLSLQPGTIVSYKGGDEKYLITASSDDKYSILSLETHVTVENVDAEDLDFYVS